MQKAQAVRLSNSMAGLRPHIVKHPGKPTWDSFHVEYSEVTTDNNGELFEIRHIIDRLV